MSRYKRQNFLGSSSEAKFRNCRVAIAGLGGGGSHVAQQFAHLGFTDITTFDPDVIDESNLNRLIGGTLADVLAKTKKTEIAKRLILGIQPDARVCSVEERWQDRPEVLRNVDLVVGCVNGFREREELERACRRYLIPLIDIGLDVHTVDGHPPRMAGQVVVSIPGGPCFRCLGFITDQVLTVEANRYGDAGDHPQVVWANGVLASSAVGSAVELLTNWTRSKKLIRYLQYDGNAGTVVPSIRLQFVPARCPHFLEQDVGDPVFKTI